jgi:hypothetical protein
LKNPDFRPQWWLCSAIRRCLHFVAKGQSSLPTSVIAGRWWGFWAPFSPQTFVNQFFVKINRTFSLLTLTSSAIVSRKSVMHTGTLTFSQRLSLSRTHGFEWPKRFSEKRDQVKFDRVNLFSVCFLWHFKDFGVILFWFCIQCVYHPFSVTSYANSSVFTWLVNTSLLLCSN